MICIRRFGYITTKSGLINSDYTVEVTEHSSAVSLSANELTGRNHKTKHHDLFSPGKDVNVTSDAKMK